MPPDEVFTKLKSNPSSVFDETIRLLVKIADNIIENPENPKIRTLQKTNATVHKKILAVKGGLECLRLMGFQETETGLVLPAVSPLGKLEEVKTCLVKLERSGSSNGAVPKIKETSDVGEDNSDLDDVKRFVLPPLIFKYTNPFLRRIETHFRDALAFDDKKCQSRAKTLIPLEQLEINAQVKLRYVQMRLRKEKLSDPEFSIQDTLLLELLAWFKEEFFSWVDVPPCDTCGGSTEMSHMSSDPQDLLYTNRVEVYKCKSCPGLAKFPRYNDLNILLETRRGRCGEWAQVFTLLCKALGWDARYVVDELDHVWTEVFSLAQRRWVHCDPCENAYDTPLMYETGWNKKLTYVIAYSPEEVQDVTWRYSSDHPAVLKRRNLCTETELVNAMMELRAERQMALSKSRKDYLEKRLLYELIELMKARQPHENEMQGRVSGAHAWREARGEVQSQKNENQYVWRLSDQQIVQNKLIIKYSAATDVYEFVRGDGSVKKINDWNLGVYSCENMARNEEKDWKMVYLARNEGAERGRISWKFELEETSCKTIDRVSLIFGHQVFENGLVQIRLISSDGKVVVLPRNNGTLLDSIAFSGARDLAIVVDLSGGKGNVAWQHAQLFRQAVDSQDFPLVLSISFKETS